jgi:ABC-type Na+ efflux pump permease subunit
MFWLVASRELREIVRDYNLVLPVFMLPGLMGLLGGFTAFGSIQGSSSAVGAVVGTLAVQQLPDNALVYFQNLDVTNQELTISLLLKAMAIPIFWVVPVALTSAVAADSFVGEKERDTLEPLLATPISDRHLFFGKLLTAVIPAVVGTWFGLGVFTALVAVSRSPYYPSFLLGDGDWFFNSVAIVPLMAVLAAGIAALISARVASFRAAYQLNGLIVLPIILFLIPQTVVLFLITPYALLYIAAGLLVADIAILSVALGIFDRERLLRGA